MSCGPWLGTGMCPEERQVRWEVDTGTPSGRSTRPPPPLTPVRCHHVPQGLGTQW